MNTVQFILTDGRKIGINVDTISTWEATVSSLNTNYNLKSKNTIDTTHKNTTTLYMTNGRKVEVKENYDTINSRMKSFSNNK